MYILGISALYHDSAAVLLCDGILVAAVQEERFSRVKFDHRFPTQAINYCLRAAGITGNDLDYIVFYEKPLCKFGRILQSDLGTFPRSWQVFREAMIAWIGEKLWIKSLIMSKFPIPPERILFIEHHLSHAASAMFCSPFKEAAVLTADGVGEWATTALGSATADWGSNGEINRINLFQEIHFPDSLGLLYSAFTAWLGFRVNSGEYKVMGMAPYGKPLYMDKLKKIVTVYGDGSLKLNMDYFSFHYSLRNTYNQKFVELFGLPRRPESQFFTRKSGHDICGQEKEADLNQYYSDVASSIQLLTEEILLRMASYLYRQTGLQNLVLAGGVAQNCVANGRLLRESPFEKVYIQPNPGDAGGALGAALYVWHVLLGKPRNFIMEHVYYGEGFSENQIRHFLDRHNIPYEDISDEKIMSERVANFLITKKVIGLFNGRFEWGPRALGNRSILADPRSIKMKDVVNTMIKFREPFRPFAPVIIDGYTEKYFDLGKIEHQYPLRFMSAVVPILMERAHEIPAVDHMGTARPQLIKREWNPLYYDIVNSFGKATGVPVLLNTSFNLRSEPIVANPADAFNTFTKSGLDVLVMGNFLVTKEKMYRGDFSKKTPSQTMEQVSFLGPQSLDQLVCPACRGSFKPMSDASGIIKCLNCHRQFPCQDNIPLLYLPTGKQDFDKVSSIVKTFYEDNPFPNYEAIDTVDLLIEKSQKSIFAKVLDEQIPQNVRILEAGCGTGQLSNFLAIRGRTVFGTDMCLNSLKLANRFSFENKLDTVNFVQMNLFRPVFLEQSFDYVICNGVLHHTADPFGGFCSLSKLVKPDGYIIIGLYNQFGRIWTDIRRNIFRMSGRSLQSLDPYLARRDVEETKKRIWFADQYRNPHESKHTIDEVLHWFELTGFQFINSIPRVKLFTKFAQYEALFARNKRGSYFEHLIVQLILALRGSHEGGLFLMIGKKIP